MAAKEKPEPLDLEQSDWVVQEMQKELAGILDDNGKPLPNTERHVLRAICVMASFSLSPQRIGNNVGLPSRRISNILKSVSVQREIARLQTELYERDATKLFKRMMPHAANTIFGLIDNAEKDSVRLEAAKSILDRALGKPTQEITQTTTLISDVLKKLNDVKVDKIEDAVLIPDVKEEQRSALSQLVSKEEASDPLEQILRDGESSKSS